MNGKSKKIIEDLIILTVIAIIIVVAIYYFKLNLILDNEKETKQPIPIKTIEKNRTKNSNVQDTLDQNVTIENLELNKSVKKI